MPIKKLGCDEYFRGLKDLKLIKDLPSSCKNLHFTEKISLDTENVPKLTYDQWLEKKTEELRINRKIEKEFQKFEKIKLKEAEEERVNKVMMSEEKFKEWKKSKLLQKISIENLRNQSKSTQEGIAYSKQKVAKEKYQEWLRSSLKTLKKSKIQEKQEKAKLEQEKQQKIIEKQKKIEKANQVYQTWLSNKKPSKKVKAKRIQKLPHQKKLILLAYSPNRKDHKSTISTEAIQVLRKSSYSSISSSNEEKLENPIFFPESYHKRRSQKSDDYRAFDELSSIQKAPKMQSIFHFEEESVESLISEL